MVITWILLAVIAVVVLWVVSAYNGLISLKNQTLNGWKQIDVQLKRRHDLIPNLVETVKGVMNFEQSTLTKVIEARNKAISAQGVAEKAAQEKLWLVLGTTRPSPCGRLNSALVFSPEGKLVASYP